MTDYILSLDKIQQKFIDPETNEQIDLPEAFGLGANPLKKEAPTVEKEITDLKDTNPAVNALGLKYSMDDGNYTDQKYTYQIQPGDTLTKIAREAQMTIPELLKINEGNPAIKTADLIYAGGNINLSKKVKSKSDIINYDTEPPAILTEEGNVARIMYNLSEKYDLPFDLVMAVGQKESGLNPYTVAGDAGTALGLMQVRGLALKDVNEHYGLNITRDQQNPKSKNYDLKKSIESGVAYLALQRDKYNATTDEQILAQYNGGPTGMRKKAARDYASSVLGMRKDVKPFDFDAKFVSDDRTPVGEVDSFAVDMDNTVREVKNANLPVVNNGVLDSALEYIKTGGLSDLNLVGSAQAATLDKIDIDTIKLTDTTKNELKKISKTIEEYSEEPSMIAKKLQEAREALTKLESGIASFGEKFGTTTDKTLEALGSGASAESGGIGFSGQGEFRPNIDLSFLNPFKKKEGVKERTVDEKQGAVTAGFSLPRLDSLFGKAEASTPKNNEIDSSLVLDKDLDEKGVADILRNGWDSVLDYVPPNVRLFATDVLASKKIKDNYKFTERMLSKDYKNILADIAVDMLRRDNNLEDNAGIKTGMTAKIGYDDWKTQRDLETGDKYSDVRYDSTEDIALSDKRFNLKTSFGQADVKINEEGDLIITDRFNFNDAQKVTSVAQLMNMVKEIGGAAYRGEDYNFVRKVGKWFGSPDGEGQFVEINLGNYEKFLKRGALDEVKLPEPKPKGLGAKS
jgi:LysM repeat protein